MVITAKAGLHSITASPTQPDTCNTNAGSFHHGNHHALSKSKCLVLCSLDAGKCRICGTRSADDGTTCSKCCPASNAEAQSTHDPEPVLCDKYDIHCSDLGRCQTVAHLLRQVLRNRANLDLADPALRAFPMTIKSHYIAICRIQDRIAQALMIMTPGCFLELTGGS